MDAALIVKIRAAHAASRRLSFPKIRSRRIRKVRQDQRIIIIHSMIAILRLIAAFIANLFKSRRRLEAEILFLRHQLNIALRRRPARFPLRSSDRALQGSGPTGAGNHESRQDGRGLIAAYAI